MSWICKACRTVVEDSVLNQESTSCPICGSDLSEDVPERSVRQITSTAFGRYELRECVGSGHFGNVWLAWDTKLKRDVALKIPRLIGAEARDRQMFLREAQSAAHLNHPGIVSVYEVGEDEACAYIVSEFVSGGTLQKYLKENPPWIPQVVEFSIQLAQALGHAHSKQLIHRDLKPGNILLSHNDRLKISDFGLAKKTLEESDFTKEGEIFGTPAYMAPEQARGAHSLVDHRADLYALGVIFYEMLTRQRPFQVGDSDFANKLQFADPIPPRSLNALIPIALEQICLKCLRKSPEDRYATAAEIEAELLQWQADRDADKMVETLVSPGGSVDSDADSPLLPVPRSLSSAPGSNVTPGRSGTDPMPLPVATPSPVAMPVAMRGTGNRVARWQVVLGVLGVLGLAAGVNFGLGKQEPASASGLGPAAAMDEGGAAGPDKTQNENKFPHMPRPLRVRIETEPAGAQVTVWGFHPAYGILDKDQFYPAPEKSPVEMELPPGDYFIVVGLEDGRFHEVLRHVPLHSGMLPDGIRHRQFETINGVVKLRSIVIPDLDVTRGMAGVKEADPFMMGDESSELSKHPRKMPAFWVDPHEVTYGRLKEVPMTVISYMGKEWPAPDLAAAAIKWDDALWAAELMGKRLLFESEYEMVATNRGTTKFPWGNDASKLDSWKFGKTLQPAFDRVVVGEIPVDGLFSNLAEWTMTPASYYPNNLVSSIELPADEFVVRGGDLDVTQGIGPGDMSLKHGAHVRSTIYKWEMREGVGFRCARSQRPRFTINDCEQMTIPNR